MRRYFALVLTSLLLTGCGKSGTRESAAENDTPAADAPQTYALAVIPKGTTHNFWKAIHAGAASAAKEFGCTIVWIGPDVENDRKQQIDVVQNMIAKGVDAIVLAPLDDQALVAPVESAVQRNIPVVVIDSGLKSELHSSFVATDNFEGGRLGARRLAEVMGGRGKVIMLRYNQGSASTNNREEGFLKELAENFPGIEVLSENQYGGATIGTAMEASQNLLNRFGDEIQGIFTPNESSTFGMLRALQNANRAGKIHHVGFDCSPDLEKGLRDGHVDGLVVQDPFQMGYHGVRIALATVNGDEVEKRVPTRLAVVTPENIDTEDIQDLIAPELAGF